jgi:hypothetical protein
MSNENEMKSAIQGVIQVMMDRVMENVLYKDPFEKDKHRAGKPLYAALVPDEIFKGSHFERKFVTPFGSVWQDLAKVAAIHGIGKSETEYTIEGTVNEERLRRITETLNKLEHSGKGEKKTRPDWDKELDYILKGTGKSIPVIVQCDLYAENPQTGKRYTFELKAPLPNSDQTKVSKEKLLKLYSMEPKLVDEAYYALPYNPYTTKANYAWPFPARWFNMKEDKVVLIGDEFWEKIGGVGTYKSFINAINEIGREYKDRIYREYLGVEPPSDAYEANLK